jgi:hypothetical protein
MLAHLKLATGRNSFDSTDASIGHAAVRGAIIGYFAVLVLVGAIVFTTAGVGLGTALAVGAYVGIWGGPGWGGMVAAQMHADRIEAAERSATRRGAEEAHRPDSVRAAPGSSSATQVKERVR